MGLFKQARVSIVGMYDRGSLINTTYGDNVFFEAVPETFELGK